jgi:hypothetical protein
MGNVNGAQRPLVAGRNKSLRIFFERKSGALQRETTTQFQDNTDIRSPYGQHDWPNKSNPENLQSKSNFYIMLQLAVTKVIRLRILAAGLTSTTA